MYLGLESPLAPLSSSNISNCRGVGSTSSSGRSSGSSTSSDSGRLANGVFSAVVVDSRPESASSAGETAKEVV